MVDLTKIGYPGKILRVNLSGEKIWTKDLVEATVRKWVGGVGLGAKYLYEEVPAEVKWSIKTQNISGCSPINNGTG